MKVVELDSLRDETVSLSSFVNDAEKGDLGNNTVFVSIFPLAYNPIIFFWIVWAIISTRVRSLQRFSGSSIGVSKVQIQPFHVEIDLDNWMKNLL